MVSLENMAIEPKLFKHRMSLTASIMKVEIQS